MFEVARIAGEYDVTVAGEQRDVCVDDIVGPRTCTQRPDGSRGARIEGSFVDTGEQSGQSGLPGTVAPGLTDTAGRTEDPITSASGCLDERRHLSVAAVEGDQSTGVEDETHCYAAPLRRRRDARSNTRSAAAISASVSAPNSPSHSPTASPRASRRNRSAAASASHDDTD